MNYDHEIIDLGELHRVANDLYTKYVIGGNESSADSILNNLSSAVENLKANWKGKAAGVRIQEVVVVHNAMVGVRNALADLAVAATKVASVYREAERYNGAVVDELNVLNFEPKTFLPEYTDTADTVFISTSAELGRTNVDAANNALDMFLANVKTQKDAILNNWVKGPGRDVADEAFASFETSVAQYKEKLANTSENITKALQNYSNL